jgi:hypothetical protein
MKKSRKIFCIILFFGALALITGLPACKGKGGASDYQWVTVDQNYAPKDAVEEFIKNDAETRDNFPLQIRNYGNDPKILRKFKGSRFAQANKNVLGMFFKGMEDWMIVDIKWKVKDERKKEGEEQPKKELEAKRTMLYVYAEGKWTVADSGTLLE